jgi:hypothetical protein
VYVLGLGSGLVPSTTYLQSPNHLQNCSPLHHDRWESCQDIVFVAFASAAHFAVSLCSRTQER